MALKRNIDPIAQFMQEHDHALVELASLNKSSRSIAEDGFSPRFGNSSVRSSLSMRK
jgi:hypothetical protein